MYRKNISAKLAVTVLLFTTIFFSCKKEGNGSISQPTSENYPINFTLAKTSNELVTLRNDPKANIIRTLKDFDVAAVLNTPLSKLSPKDLADFRQNIVFRKDVGVVGLKYGNLERTLSYDDFAIVLSMFGMDVKEGYWGFSKDPAIQAKLTIKSIDTYNGVTGVNLAAQDYKEYLCSLTISHTCKKAVDCICLSGC